MQDHLLDLTVVPVIDHQEYTHAFAYWEGAMRFTGEDVQGSRGDDPPG